MSKDKQNSPAPLLSARKVREIFGVSDMTLYRWSKRPELNFPRPIVIAGRKYWREADINNFIAARARAA